MTAPISSFRELRVYVEACDLDYEIFVTSKVFPREGMYSLIDQVRRSSRSIGANIAEAWAKRRYPAHFVSKLTDADAELQETRHWLDRANACGYLPAEKRPALEQCCDRIGGMLGNMILHPESFSHSPA